MEPPLIRDWPGPLDVGVSRHPQGDVEVGTIFRSPGLRLDGTIFAFLGFDGELIVKLPNARGQELIAAGEAAPVTMGTRTMKEWFELPSADAPDQAYQAWLPLVREALAFVRGSGGAGQRTVTVMSAPHSG
ncbi:TfoX/Sxy family protein [Brachybacterium sp. p3-SID957]|uniref:TfoX/Sxy family protein n=1 Tax=Brachybacterium sp. p3-SID957 TaxID=2916049 RepID=UPI00223B58E9|nr:TfoX/Sxy family protein [Brachybacterium sp. p3-SID957]MCT1775014.1 TfoX/Sxy family protein [Brachybacterium sp. p3-SID957]